MSMLEALKAAGFKAEKSEVGGKFILEGIYKAQLIDVAAKEDKGYGASIYASFKIEEKLCGMDSNSQYPEFKGYFNTAPEKIASKRNGLAKLINGLFSVGYEVKGSTDEELIGSLDAAKGISVYIKGYKQAPQKKNEDGSWSEDPEGETKQGFAFMTEKLARKQAEKEVKSGNF